MGCWYGKNIRTLGGSYGYTNVGHQQKNKKHETQKMDNQLRREF